MKINMEFVTMLFILLPTLPLSFCIRSHSSKIRSSLVFPLYHQNHPKIKALNPLSLAPIGKYKDKLLFFISFYVGTPAIKASALFDTGSGFSWLEDTRESPSATYRPVGCNQVACAEAPDHKCSFDSQTCMYGTRYADGSTSEGTVGTDIFYLFRANREGSHDPDFVVPFHMMYGTPRRKGNSLLGVMGAESLRSALGVKYFSICFPTPPDNVSYVRFDDDAYFFGETTQLLKPFDHFRFKVNSISMEGLSVVGGEFILDTGAALSYLHPVAFDKVVDMVERSIDAVPTEGALPYNYELCYDTSDRPSYRTVDLVFHVDGGGHLTFNYKSLWKPFSVCQCECLTFLRSTTYRSILGMHHMWGINFAFDVDNMILTYKKDTCEIPYD